MGENSKIAWTTHTVNFWIGCKEVSDHGCLTCYARELDKRYQYGVSGEQAKLNRAAGIAPNWVDGVRHRTSASNWAKPLRWDRDAAAAGAPCMVFTESLSDFFDNQVDPAWREAAWKIIKATPNLRWQILTKRSSLIKKMLPADWGNGYPNVGLVASVSTQAEFMRDAPRLLRVSARWHGFSLEPQVERIVLPGFVASYPGNIWFITGGDSAQPSSGHKPRPYDVEWARGLITASKIAPNIKIFVKQLGAAPLNAPPQTDAYGAEDPAEWPEDIRVRDFVPELLS